MGTQLVMADVQAVDDFVEEIIEDTIYWVTMPDGSFDEHLIDATLEVLSDIWVTLDGWEEGREMSAADLLTGFLSIEELCNPRD